MVSGEMDDKSIDVASQVIATTCLRILPRASKNRSLRELTCSTKSILENSVKCET